MISCDQRSTFEAIDRWGRGDGPAATRCQDGCNPAGALSLTVVGRPVLYSELTIIVEPGDIVCMRKKHLKGMEKAKKKVWRHNPLHGIGYCD